MHSFSQVFRHLIDEANLTQQDVAEALGVSQRAVSGWLQGSVPRSGKLKRLADFFNVPVEVLEGKQAMVKESQQQYQKQQQIQISPPKPKSEIQALVETIENLPEGAFKEKIIEKLAEVVIDFVMTTAEEEIDVAGAIINTYKKDISMDALQRIASRYSKKQPSASLLARELNKSGTEIPVPRSIGEIFDDMADKLKSG